jgi:PAS domain-containing protein
MKTSRSYILSVIVAIKTAMPFRIQCYRFATILTTIFPDAVIYYNGEHCITRIDQRFYDIDGYVGFARAKDFIPLDEYGIDIKKTLQIAKRGYYEEKMIHYLNINLSKSTIHYEESILNH